MEFSEYLYYDASSKTGLRWLQDGKPAGCLITEDDYQRYVVSLFGIKHINARVVWELHNGRIPSGYVVDHIDGDSTNNAIGNLRVTTQRTNLRNRAMQDNNKSGVTGVCLVNVDGRELWKASWKDLQGIKRSKHFSLSKYGEDAFALACKCRQDNINLLNADGAGYTSRHGIPKGA